MAQSKKSNNELRQLLLKRGNVVPGDAETVAVGRSFDLEASRANAIASRRAELHRVPAVSTGRVKV